MTNPFFNAHHSPVGAFATFTLGMKGARGGLGLELAGPANENVWIGVEDRDQAGRYHAFPFFNRAEAPVADYDVEHLAGFERPRAISPFGDTAVERNLGAAIDEWKAGDLTCRIVSPVRSVPDPEQAHESTLKDAVVPAVLVEITVDNREGTRPRQAFFGFQGSDRSAGMRVLNSEGLTGIGQHTMTAIATNDPSVWAGLAFQPERILEPDSPEDLHFLVGNTGLLVGQVPAGERKTFQFAIAFFREGTATTGIKTRYLYRRFFEDIEGVLRHALTNFDQSVHEAEALDARLLSSLPPARAWMMAQAIRSYFGSTQLLESEDGTPLWVVNEGEYRMMNTFDLTVDQAFFELAMNPWTVRNVLDLYVERYAYESGVRFPNSPEVHPGGISFTHDMGVANSFSRPGFSGYEQTHQKGCFSYMTAEELMNWVLTAGLYDHFTFESGRHDIGWAVSHRATFLSCLRSLVNRDHPDASRRNGMVGLDSARCQGGSEITTYDSLDASLGQARNNLYLGVKGWAAYLLLENVLRRLGDTDAADEAGAQAARTCRTIVDAADKDGQLPAILGEGVEARIIPVIEALAYPAILGLEIDPALKAVLSRHLEAVLQPGICRFDDEGWKLSSTSRNSWLSKIYLCQYVAEQVLGFERDLRADEAHRGWLLDGENAYFAWSDQMLSGKAVGSRYYPRGVTSILWLAQGADRLHGIRRLLHPKHADLPQAV